MIASHHTRTISPLAARFLAGSIAALLAAPSGHAATYYWDGTTVGGTGDGTSLGGATGLWDISTVNWDQGSGLARIAWPNDTTLGNTDTAVFGGTAGTVTLADDITVGGLTFNTTGYTITGVTNSKTLTFGGTDNVILLNNVATANINGAVGGSGNVILTTSNPATAGNVNFNNATTGGWSGTTTVNAGMTLTIDGSVLNRDLLNTSGITLNGGAIAFTNIANNGNASEDRINNAAAWTVNSGTFTWGSSNNVATYAETIGTVTVNRGQMNFVLRGDLTSGSQALTIGTSGVGLAQTGTSTVTFSNTNTALNSSIAAASDVIRVNGITASTPANQIIGPWATVGSAAGTQTDFAKYVSDGTYGYVVAAAIADTAFASWANSTTNAWSYNTGASDTINTTYQAAAVKFYGGASTLTLGTGNLETYGLFFSGANAKTVASTGGALTTPTGGGNLYLMAGNTGASTISAPINNNGGAVTVVVGNAVGRTLTLSSTTSNYSGGTVINAGTLVTTADTNLGTGGGVTFNGNATWNMGVGSAVTYNRAVTVNEGAVFNFASGNALKTVTGVLSGNGAINMGGVSTTLEFNNTGNTFTGTLNTGYEMRFNSLGDSSNAINLGGATTGFTWQGNAKTFTQRPFTLNATGTNAGVITSNGGALVIEQDLAITGAAGTRTLTLQGTSNGSFSSTFAGDIADGTSGGASVVTLSKSGTGTWALGGTNTYSGVTNLAAASGRLIFQGSQSLSSNTSSIVFNQASSNVQAISLLDDGAGTINFNKPLSLTGSNTTQVMSIFVGNNNTANGGSSAGTTTGSTIQVGAITHTLPASDTTSLSINVTGANAYRLRTGTITLNNLTVRTAAQTTTTILNPTTANMTVDAITMATGNVTADDGIPVIRLAGIGSDNIVTGAISNATDFATGHALSLEKQGISTWTLQGTNTYTGATTITTGKLLFSGASSLPTTGTVAVGADGLLSLADGTARNQTVSALTLASLGSLSFDWTGSGTGDQLTSTANITPTGGSGFVINLNRSGTPAGPLTLLTGGAGSTLSSSTFYLANLTDFTATLTTPTVNTLVVNGYTAATALPTFYWQGDKLSATIAGVRNAWALSNGTVSNWSSTTTAYTATALTPGATANVIFADGQVGKTQQSTVLGADVTVNSVTIADSTPVTIAGANGAALTLMSTGILTSDSAISVTSTAVTPTISSRVVLGADQTWHVAASKTLTVSGIVSGAFGLTKKSAGTVALTALPEYTGTTTISTGALTFGGGATGGASIIGNTSGITLSTGATLNFNPSTTGINNIYTAGAPITLSGGAGTASIRVGGNDVRLYVSGNVTGESAVAQTLSISQGLQPGGTTSTGDRQAIRFSGVIANGGSGGTLGVSVDFAGASGVGQNAFVNLSGQNTFTGNLTVANSKGLNGSAGSTHQGAWLIIGGERYSPNGPIISSMGNGYLGGGNYSGNISMSAGAGKTTVDYFSTADQTLGGIISGSAALQMDGTGTLTLTNTNNSYTGSTTINSGTLAVSDIDVVANPNALGQSSAAAANLILRGGTLKYTTGGAASTDRNFALASSSTIDASGAGALTFSQTGDVSPDVTGLLTFNAAGGAKLLTNLSSTANLVVGMSVTGTGIAAGSTIQSIDSATQVTLASSANVTLGTGVAASFGYGSRTLTLTGTNTGANTISGNLVNSTAAGTGVLSVTKSGVGTWVLTGANTYTGATTISAGSLQLGSGGTTGRLTATTSITNNGNLTINRSDAFSQASDLGAGVAITGTGSFTQAGGGTTTLTAANTYTGATTVGTALAGAANIVSPTANGGTLVAGAVDALKNTTGIAVNNGGTLLLAGAGTLDRVNNSAGVTLGTTGGTGVGGTIALSGTASEGGGAVVTGGGTPAGTNVDGFGSLTLSSNSTLDFASGNDGTMVFAGFTPGAFTLNISGYSNSTFDGSMNSGTATDDRLIFHVVGGLSAGDLGSINFGDGLSASQLHLGSDFYEVGGIVVVPESTTILGAFALLGLAGYRERRRLPGLWVRA